MRKISIILPNLNVGGAERLAVNLANDWINRGFNIEFVLMNDEGQLLKLLNPKISIVTFKVKKIRSLIFPLIGYMRKNNSDVIWVNMWPITTVAVLAWILSFRNGKLFITDHNQLSQSCVREMGVSRYLLGLLIRFSYPFATAATAVSNGVAADLSKLSKLKIGTFKVIYNPAAIGASSERLSEKQSEILWGKDFDFHILAVGSLKAQKNQELLIRAFSKLRVTYNAKLIILGEGELRGELERLIKVLKLESRVSLPGFRENPYPFFQSADMFVMSSNWEGFGNVIVEALECGIPVVSTDCPSGPAEILEGGRYGQLVPVGDVESLTLAMQECLIHLHDRDVLIQRSKDFSIDLISEKYLCLFGLPLYV
jgi:glycosyltransferase involved in cell wall biosynthesis